MKVLYLNPASGLGGAERSLLDLLASVRAALPAAVLHLVVPEDGPLVDQARALEVGVTLLKMPDPMVRLGDSALARRGRLPQCLAMAPGIALASLTGMVYLGRLRRTIRQFRPDVVHSNGIKTHILACLAGAAGGHVIWHLRDFLQPRPAAGRLLRSVARGASRGLAISRAVARDARAVLPGLPVDLVPNAIDTRVFSPGIADGARLDQLAGIAPNDAVLRVGLVATYARWKGHEVFLEAAARLARREKLPLRFYIIGGPIYDTRGSQFTRQELEKRIRAFRLADCTGLVPFQLRPANVYRALDIAVHASTQPEPFGRAIVEAMACGRPVIVSQTGGAAELFTPMEDAVAVRPGDPVALADAIDRLARDAGLRTRLGRSARRTAVGRFARPRLGRQILEVYHSVLSEYGSRAPRSDQPACPPVILPGPFGQSGCRHHPGADKRSTRWTRKRG